MPGQHQVEQPRRQHAARAQTEPRAEPGFFPRVGWGAVSVGFGSGTFAGAIPLVASALVRQVAGAARALVGR